MKIPKMVLKKGREISIERRHPWIFSGAFLAHQILDEGTIVEVCKESGERLGFGFFLRGSIRVKLFSFYPQAKLTPLEVLIENLRAAIYLRKGLAFKDHTNCFRLVNAEGDSLPGLIIDIYDNIAVCQLHHPGWMTLLESLAPIINSEIGRKAIYIKSHEEIEGSWISEPAECPVLVKENGLRFAVDFINGQKTGFFLDQRESRSIVGDYSNGRTILNLFSYSGGFSAYALRGGAQSAVSVDVSQKACDEAFYNMELNGFSERHSADCKDCFKYLENLSDKFDFIVLDPPALTKHRDSVNQAIKGYKHLNRSALRALPKHGLLATFSCSQLVSREQFEALVYGVCIEVGRSIKIISRFFQAPCHPASIFHAEGNYLKGLLLEVL